MERKTKKKIGIVFIIFFLFAVYKDSTGGYLKENHILLRDEEKEQEVHLVLEGEDIVWEYEWEIPPIFVTKEEAEHYFSEAITCITEDFQKVEERLPLSKSYVNGKVNAEWDFGTVDCIEKDGTILQHELPEDNLLVNVQVFLSCGAYEQIYTFPIEIKKKPLSKQEHLLQAVEEWMDMQMMQEGSSQIQLPTEVEGVSLKWSEKRESVAIKVLCLEGIAMLFLWWGEKQQVKQEEQKRVRALELEYANLIYQLSMLLEAGMTIRQAWGKIAAQYERTKNVHPEKQNSLYEQIVAMNRRLEEGENERVVYQKFADKLQIRCYYQLMRTLCNHLEKGSKDLCKQLEEECRRAYEEKILIMKKMGEEASTKMLVPLMGMMFLVLAIVLLPAILGMTI